jgi:hypothetical protein
LFSSTLTRLSISSIAISTTWEALQTSGMTDQQLEEAQHIWESVDFLTQPETAFAMERTWHNSKVKEARRSYMLLDTSAPNSQLYSALKEFGGYGEYIIHNPKEGMSSFWARYPKYWHWKYWRSYDNELVNEQLIQAALQASRQEQRDHLFLPSLKQLELDNKGIFNAHPNTGDYYMVLESHGQLEETIYRLLFAEIERSLVITAIALKRHHLEYGTYPQTLSALSPQFLLQTPRDPVDGKPLRYRRNADGSFLLYSIGSNGVDDGGDCSQESIGANCWLKAKDEVWPSPATHEEIKAFLDQFAPKRQRGKFHNKIP